eukprot:Gregarina_sp_Pseudo_9__5175@NODE_557_length_2581_cov_54_791109_g526_i0_p2_GENE_NODE_557_length_2581_cov_54_791109_g526_i0NODE_557_length_2581_cov_54_791109_g526_i0_p2_ORF_typecomplete_len302_score100_87Thioesterase/PF00975_20/4_4e19Hydrolase_4/PF12146_8/1_5e14Abhydrolase_6/PF12697_7/7_2e14Abhydrolase_1/PF00561_20/6_9e09DUF1057/PF06342_12/4_4e07DUF1057/PF06342_12/5_5e03Ser_hydrolase/PF06821_13/0_00057Abhydrolase_5/PF12695_7/0_47Abhydrolase_5/PF12695_7/0_84DUF1749/PF08538_10/0_1DUF1749/PF08538_10/
MQQVSPRQWFPNQPRLDNPKGVVVCFHNAGGDASMFVTRYIARRPVGNELADFCQARHYQLLAPLLPGRSYNHAESLEDASVNSLVESIFFYVQRLLRFQLHTRPVFLLGHSLGCFFAFEFARKMLQTYETAPRLLFLSSAVSPSLPVSLRPWKPVAAICDEELRQAMPNWDMKPEGLEPRMWQVFGKLIRADMQLLDNYVFDDPTRIPIDSALTKSTKLVLLRGAHDKIITPEHINGWRACVPQATFVTYEIPNATHALYLESESRKYCYELFIKEASRVTPCSSPSTTGDDLEDEVHGF